MHPRQAAWEKKAVIVFLPHVGHMIQVNNMILHMTSGTLEPNRLTMAYGGFAVRCLDCNLDLSEQIS